MILAARREPDGKSEDGFISALQLAAGEKAWHELRPFMGDGLAHAVFPTGNSKVAGSAAAVFPVFAGGAGYALRIAVR